MANYKSGILGMVSMSQSSEDGALKIKGYIKGLPAGKILCNFFNILHSFLFLILFAWKCNKTPLLHNVVKLKNSCKK